MHASFVRHASQRVVIARHFVDCDRADENDPPVVRKLTLEPAVYCFAADKQAALYG